MSWYQNKLRAPNLINNNSSNKFFNITITIPNMNTDDDFQKIKSALLAKDGISNVERIGNSHKLKIILTNSQSLLTTVAYTLANLGFNYLKRG